MRHYWLCLGLLLAATIMSSQTSDHATDRAYIEKAESDWAESVASHDCTVLERVLADDFVGVDVDGSHYTKAANVGECKTYPSNFAFNHLDGVQIRFYGDTAIAQGSESWKLVGGKPGKFVWTDTWLKRNGKWQIVAAEDLMPVPSPFSPPHDAAKELTAMENRYNDALLRGAWQSLDSILADDLIFNNADGSVNHKPDTISSVRSGDIKFDSIAMSDVNVQDFGGVGIVTGKLVEKARYKSSDLSGSYRFLDVWVKRQVGWQNVAGQETRYKQ